MNAKNWEQWLKRQSDSAWQLPAMFIIAMLIGAMFTSVVLSSPDQIVDRHWITEEVKLVEGTLVTVITPVHTDRSDRHIKIVKIPEGRNPAVLGGWVAEAISSRACPVEVQEVRPDHKFVMLRVRCPGPMIELKSKQP